MIHENESPLAGKTVKLIAELGGEDYHVEDWWDRIAGKSWMDCNGNPACMNYAMRTGMAKHDVPTNNEVLYGKIGGLGHLIHVTEVAQ